jgi:hypothetical protein
MYVKIVFASNIHHHQKSCNSFCFYGHSLTDPAVNEQENKLEAEYNTLRSAVYSGDYFVTPIVDPEFVGSSLTYSVANHLEQITLVSNI